MLVENEPNTDAERAQSLTLPALVAGRFDEPRDADWFAFQVPENGTYYLEIFSERIGARADPFAMVFDDKMNVVAEYDDYGHRVRAVDAHLRDPYGSMNLQKDKPYKLLVQDRYSRGGPRYQYVLSVRAPKPDFQAVAMWGNTQNVRAGGYEFLDIVVNQSDGFANPVTITAEGLPPGVSALPCVVFNTIHGQLILKGEPNAPKGEGSFKLWATAKVGEVEVRREVKPTVTVFGQQSGVVHFGNWWWASGSPRRSPFASNRIGSSAKRAKPWRCALSRSVCGRSSRPRFHWSRRAFPASCRSGTTQFRRGRRS